MSQAVNEIKKLPQGWRRAPLRETADIVRGISFPKEARRLEPQEGSVACLRTANPESTDGRREDSVRGVRELQAR